MKPWKSADRPDSYVWKRCFNGATAMKPWKSDHSRRIAKDRRIGFNGATAMKPWKS